MAGGVTRAGKAIITAILDDATWYMALGVGMTAYAATQTALVSEIVDSGMARAAATPSRVLTYVTNDTLRLSKTWTVTGTKTVTEAGIFDAAAAGNMLCRDKLDAAKDVVSGDSFTSVMDIPFA